MRKTKIYSVLALFSLLTMIMAMGVFVPAKASPTASLIGQWDFDEGAGKIALDSSVNSNHGTLSGGKFGGCLEFDGINDYLIVPDSAELDVTGPITIEAWIKPYSLPPGDDPSGDAVIVSKYNQYIGERSYRLHIRNGLLSFYLSDDGTSYVTASAGDMTGYVGEWVHVAFTFDGTNCNLYINGIAQSVSVTTSSIFASTSPLYMGAYLPTDLRPFEGQIDEVRICNVAKTTFDLNNPPDDTDAVGLWHFDEETGQTAADSAGINDVAQLGSTSGTDVNDPIWISSGPTWVPRNTGYALCFDGVDDVVYIDNEENFDFNYDDAFSIEAMFQTDSDEMLCIVSKYLDAMPHRGFQLIKHSSDNGNLLYFFFVNTYVTASSGEQIRCFGSTDVADGEWHHVIVTYDGSGSVSGVNIYLDGVPETIGWTIGTVSADTTNDFPVQISGREGTHYVFDGCIDEVKIWGVELQAPVADANGPYIFDEGSEIIFDGSGSSDADGTIVLYEWDLDDDGQYDDATGVTTSYTWFDDYSELVGLRVTDDNGLIDTDSATVTVNNVSPDVDAGADDTINEGDTFTGGGSFTDPGTDSWDATVDYDEGAGEESLALSGNTFSLSNVYEEDGIYTVTVTVNDDDGGTGSDTLIVTVNNEAPTIDSLTGDTIDENGIATVSGTFSDPGTEDTFTVTIDWGEGSPEDYAYPAGSTSFSETHQYLDDNPTATTSDPYTVSVTVTDDDTGSNSASTTVIVKNVAPTIDSLTGDTINEGGTATVSGTFSDVGTLDSFTVDIDWDDGSTDTYSYGVGSTSFSHTHVFTVTGVYDVSVTVIDDDTGEDSDTVRVVVLPYSDLTNGALCPDFDREPDTLGDQFRLIFTPDLNGNPNEYKIATTNPGQFYYNIFHVGEVSPDDPFTISVPSPFVTQGANPIHVYDGADINEYGCYVPGDDITAQFDITNFGSALYFDEGHDYLDFGDGNFEFGRRESFTAECWIKTNQNPTDFGGLVEIMGTYGATP
jgi:PKD repeat protein